MSFDSPKTCKLYLMYSVFAVRLVTIIIYEIWSATVEGARWIEFLSNTFIFVYPFVEFTYLFFIHTRLSLQLHTFYMSFDCTQVQVAQMKGRLQRTSVTCFVIIIIQVITQFCLPLPEFTRSRGWMVKRTFPTPTRFGLLCESLISITVYCYEAIVVTYIPLSASLYMFYLTLIMCLKGIALERVSSCTVDGVLQMCDQLDDVMDCFEEHLSILPFNWLGFCLGPCLCYLLLFVTSEAVLLHNVAEIAIQVYIQTCNILLTLFSLFIISKWQEALDKSVDKMTRSLERSVCSPIQLRLLDRLEKVFKRSVTIWFICPINRSLILAYIGSAITFSTLFIQLQR